MELVIPLLCGHFYWSALFCSANQKHFVPLLGTGAQSKRHRPWLNIYLCIFLSARLCNPKENLVGQSQPNGPGDRWDRSVRTRMAPPLLNFLWNPKLFSSLNIWRQLHWGALPPPPPPHPPPYLPPHLHRRLHHPRPKWTKIPRWYYMDILLWGKRWNNKSGKNAEPKGSHSLPNRYS